MSSGAIRASRPQAIDRREPTNACLWGASLGLCVLYRQCDAPCFERAAVRWLERFLAERRPTLEQVGLAVGALAELRAGNGAASMFTLKRLVRRA